MSSHVPGRCTPLFRFVTLRPFSLRLIHMLPANSYYIRCIGDYTRPKTYYQHPGHCYNSFFLTACSSPYSHELSEEDRILADCYPQVLNEGSPDEPRPHTGDAPFPRCFTGGVLTLCQPHKAGYFLSACETGQILSQFQHQPDGGKPPDPRSAPGYLEGFSVPLLTAELTEGCPECCLMDPKLLQHREEHMQTYFQRFTQGQLFESMELLPAPLVFRSEGNLDGVEVQELTDTIAGTGNIFWIAMRVRLICRSSLRSLSGTSQAEGTSLFSRMRARRFASLLSVLTLFTLGSVTR